ncbi:MAG: amidase [Kiritimatiellae bacterium]|jgi:amidase|nr:amidase [Kiritimatiellia bacterium]
MSVNELFYASAGSLARRIRDRQISSEEVVKTHLRRIESINPCLNALVQSAAKQAVDDAREADTAIARGQPLGVLHGVPFTVKDWIDAAGLPCTGGDPAFRNRVPAVDAAVVARMRRAGAILLGKTNVMADNKIYGRTNNPYNLTHSASGSSSGEAALIAAGGSPLGLGSDSGGSIRLPTHACGICGLKPTTGRVPISGHFPFISAMQDPRTAIGAMARFVEDLALALPILCGMDWKDASVVPMPLADWQTVDVKGLRIAYYTCHEGADPTPETVETCRQAARILADLGMHVEEMLPPRITEASAITRQYWQRPSSFSEEEWAPNEKVRLNSEEVERHLFMWDRFRRALIGFMAHYDVILTPAAERPAPQHGTKDGWVYTLPYSLTGWPCVVVRAGTAPDELPIGVQIVSRPWREDVALAVGHVIERSLGGWQPPKVFALNQNPAIFGML